MRIVVVGNFGLAYKGTMAARALPIARELARRGHDVELILPADGASPPKALDDTRVLIRSVGARARASDRFGWRPDPTELTFPRVPFSRAALGAAIVGEALRAKPDVLYGFKPIGYAGLALQAAWTARQIRTARPLLAVDADDWEGRGGWADRDGGPSLRTAIVSWQERWCLGHADVVTVASRELEKRVEVLGGRVVYAPNAASPTSPGWTAGNRAVGRAQLGLADEPIVLAYTRFVEFAPARLVAVAARILDRQPNARLVVAGQGLDGEEREFGRLMSERGLASRVRLLGWTSPDDLPNVFAAADLALYPLDDSLLNRAKCPMKLVDLMLAGVPVVADAVGQAKEYIQNGVSGLLVNPGDVDALASRALELLDDSPTRLALGRQARQEILANWTWSRQADAIDQALLDAAGNIGKATQHPG